MAVKNRQDFNSPADDELADFLFESLTTGILIGLLKRKITAGQANAADVIQKIAGDNEAAVVILKRK